jgi:hypothetical protein
MKRPVSMLIEALPTTQQTVLLRHLDTFLEGI